MMDKIVATMKKMRRPKAVVDQSVAAGVAVGAGVAVADWPCRLMLASAVTSSCVVGATV